MMQHHNDPDWDEKEPAGIVRCRAVQEHHRLLRTSPEYRARRREIEFEVREWLRAYGNDGLRTGLIRIPVVVHVVWNTPEQNISDAQIHSQIDVLNEDFRRLNADAAGTPAPFAAVAADARLEFALAVRGPGCVPTTGINRVHTSVTGWTYPGNGMKSAATGGADPWDSSQYLNVWIVNYTDGTLGFGTFPGGAAAVDGLVLKHSATGRSGTLIGGADRGRTGTHEIGHWLDLHHIWGDDGTACYGSDLVADTPNQAGPSPFNPSACRVFPAVSCSNGPNGDMFMNYMDYSADQCLTTFTAGQVARMDAALHTARSSILASPGLVPPTGVGPDLWCKDTSDDDGTEPNPSSQPMYISDDIYVRRQNDGLANQDHENPEYRVPGGAPNYVYVRVRNRACGGSQSGTVKLYWAKASSGLSWPAPWDGSVTAPALMGQPLGSQPVSVLGGDDEILVFPWSPPDPTDYASFGADQHHFCLLARIETSASSPFGMSSPETTNLYSNVVNNNNIVWKNISVVDDLPGTGRTAGLLVANYGRETQKMVLRFTMEQRRPSLLDWGRVQFAVPYELAKRLREADSKGIEWISETRFLLEDVEGIVQGVELRPKEMFALDVTFIPDGKAVLGAGVFPVDVQQFDGDEPIGGVRVLLRTHGAHRPNYADGCGDGYLAPLDGDNFIGGPAGRPCVPRCGC
ncbi:MAG: zinc metalloprotease [Arachnia sp.]